MLARNNSAVSCNHFKLLTSTCFYSNWKFQTSAFPDEKSIQRIPRKNTCSPKKNPGPLRNTEEMQDNFSGNQSLRPTCWDILTFDKGKNNSPPPIFCSKLPPHPFSPPGIPNNSRAKSHDLSWEHQHPSAHDHRVVWGEPTQIIWEMIGWAPGNSSTHFLDRNFYAPLKSWSFSHNSPLKRDLFKAPSKERHVVSSMHHCFQGIVHFCIPINKREWPWKIWLNSYP